jgi:hypothetical protein
MLLRLLGSLAPLQIALSADRLRVIAWEQHGGRYRRRSHGRCVDWWHGCRVIASRLERSRLCWVVLAGGKVRYNMLIQRYKQARAMSK